MCNLERSKQQQSTQVAGEPMNDGSLGLKQTTIEQKAKPNPKAQGLRRKRLRTKSTTLQCLYVVHKLATQPLRLGDEDSRKQWCACVYVNRAGFPLVKSGDEVL